MKGDQGKPLTVRCPHCGMTREPDRNEVTGRYHCPLCSAYVDAQVLIEKRKRKID